MPCPTTLLLLLRKLLLAPAIFSLALMNPTATTAAAAASAPETMKPDIGCTVLGGNNLNYKCATAGFSGLQGHSASELLYDIISQSTLPNDTFYKNDRHVACLFRDTKFVLEPKEVSAGAGAKAGPATFEVGVTGKVDSEADGTLCAYPYEVPEGGLTLGQVRDLAEELVNTPNCNLCGQITANYHSRNASALGRLKFNWRDNAACQRPCILESDLRQANATDAKPVPQEEGGDHKKNVGHGISPSSSVLFWTAAAFGSVVTALL
ncbi:hypothetical protein PG996_011837 [Apiospora saccharicola]|uniref:Uncharacterized protein n=1 Tax=Apiospora saccharicola TaxID=335842 RepID=A0ABR1UG72_9PEZI